MKMQKSRGQVRSGMGVEGWGGGWSSGRGFVGSKVGVGSDVGYRGSEPRIEGIVQCT